MIYFVVLIFIKVPWSWKTICWNRAVSIPWFRKQKFVPLDAEPGMVVDDILIKQSFLFLLFCLL